MDLVTATDIARWADLREAQGQLPRLVRRLIAVTANGLKVISVRSGEGVAYPGWDGVVVASGADAHVPEGVSVWEMGVNANPGVKANGDHRKRTERPGDVVPTDTTFVFVTPRRWGGRADWVKERTDEGHWKRVIAFDGDDLETWLERAPSVHAWFSAQLGKDPYEAESLETWWESWIAATNPPFLPALLLSGRDAVGERIRGQVNAGAGSLALSGDSQEEVVAFIAATLIGSGVDEPLANLGRSLIVRTPGAWRRLAVSEFPLILIPLFEKADVTLATRHGHTVLLPFARGGGLGSGEELPRLRRDGLEAALLESGLSRERAGDLATLGRRSLLALRRTLAVSPEVHAPEWSRPEHARDVLPAIMAGQWNDRAEGDREAIAALADQPYDETVEHLTRWAHLSDPPVRRVGDVWLVAAKQDAWLMTARFLTTQDLERFSQVALEVLGGDDPAFDLPPGERLMASILGKQRSHSGHLLEGLADTLALIASLSDQIPLVGGRRGQEIATGVVRRLLDSANEDESGRRWISLADVLPLLAEASPDTFLNAVDAGLRGEAPIVLRMFQDGEGFNSMFGSSAHPSLLWALENVAWSPEHLGRTALLLAKLTRMDPGGRLDNRPAKSLREILLLWRPGTAATVDQKLQVVDLLRASEPDVAWPLMLDLIPSGRNTASSTHAPRRREWKQDAEAITWRDVFSAVEGLVDRAQEDAGTNGSRWATVIGRIEGLTPELRARIVERIRNMSPSDFDEAGRAHIANALRYLVGRHREYPDATWALPEHEIDEIDRLVSTFEPDAPLLRYAWLFDQGALYSFGGLDREEKREEWSTAQAQAIRAVVDAVGVDAVLVWAEQFQSLSFSAHQIGWALGSIELDPLGEDALLSQLASEVGGHRVVAAAFVSRRLQSKGEKWWEWADDLVRSRTDWSPRRRAAFLAVLPAIPQVWDLAEELGGDADREYWHRIGPYAPPHEAEPWLRAARKFLEHARPYDALVLLDANDAGPPSELVADALEQTARTPPPGPLDTMFQFHVGRHLDRLLEGGFDEARLAQLEWLYLPAFRFDSRPPGVLHRALAAEPEFFVQIVSAVYMAKGEEPGEEQKIENSRRDTARDLLESWRLVPGARGDGILDGEALLSWISTARELLAEAGRAEIGDYCIGRVIRYGPGPDNDVWPAEPIRRVVETVASDALEAGLRDETYNSRGVTTRGLTDGGQQERALASTYRKYARSVELSSPRTAALLRGLAESYEQDARRHDADSELTEDLWR